MWYQQNDQTDKNIVKSICYTVQDQTIEFLCRNNSALLVQNDHYSGFQT